MKEQKKYHQRKLVIIEMIEECGRRIDLEESNMRKYSLFQNMYRNCKVNIIRYSKIKIHLLERYNRQ
jgi:hypothetical protein